MQTENHFERRWSRSETRQIRPFRHMEDYLNEVALRLHEDEEFSKDTRIHKERIDTSRLSPVVQTAMLPVDLAERVGIPIDALRLVILIEDGFLKKATTLHQSRLDEAIDECIALSPERVLQTATWTTETKVHVAVVLAENREPSPGVAHREGSWVAKKTFEIAREINVARLPIEPVDKDWFVSKGLPADTAYHVEVLDTDFDNPSATFQEMVSIKANKSMIEALERNQNSLTSKAIIGSIYTDIATSILSIGLKSVDGNPLPESALCSALNRISQRTGVPIGQLIEWATRDEDSNLRAAVQAETGLTHALISAARRTSI